MPFGRRLSTALSALSALVAATYAVPSPAQRTPPTPQDAKGSTGATVYGTVHDSIAARPLVGAIVQLVTADTLADFGRTIVSDSIGRFSFDSVPAGRYAIGFFHPMLDSLGLDPIARTVTVTGTSAVQAHLAVPSSARLRAAICGASSGSGAGAVLIGSVHDAHGRTPAVGATVIAEWIELTFGKAGMTRRVSRRTSTTREKGWFSFCNVPSPGIMMLMATRGADSTAMIDVEVSASGFQRRELYLGPSRSVTTAADNTRKIRVGDGLLSGIVRTTTDDRPLAGAQISIVDGPNTRSNARGEWTLTDAPSGTRLLEVRAVGYYPERRAVDIVDSIAPVRVALTTFKSVLDTMKVSATRTIDMNMLGFQERRRSGMGRFLTPREIDARQPVVTSDIFRSVPGLFLERTVDAGENVMMRGIYEDRCVPAIYIDGRWMSGLTSGDLDGFIRPNNIAGIEVYRAGQVPARFQPELSGCGSLVFWTK